MIEDTVYFNALSSMVEHFYEYKRIGNIIHYRTQADRRWNPSDMTVLRPVDNRGGPRIGWRGLMEISVLQLSDKYIFSDTPR